MRKETEVRLAKAVMSVRATSTHAWDEFLKAIADHLDDVTEECISAPIDTLQERQGRAREIRDLFKALVGAPELAAQLQDKERKDAGRR
jgi:hypothetical protein